LAAQMLVKSGYLADNKYTITKSRGVDIFGRNNAGHTVVIEVKTSGKTLKDHDFGGRLSTGSYKQVFHEEVRQMDDRWLQYVHPDIDITKTHVLGVFINTNTGVATLYRRASSDATEWKYVMKQYLPALKLETE